MKKLISIFLITLINLSIFAGSLKDYVCIVEPQIPESTKEFLTEYKDELLQKGYKSYASYIEAYLKGSFGSGFIVKDSIGKTYILTNRHVVFEAQTAIVKFENYDGSVSEYKDMKILAADEDVDVALIALPDSFKRPALKFSTVKLSDGDDVWSAGFPGLGSEPVWQLGKGIVSNSSARIKELLDPEISTIIQHSAQVDGGNSGGPLLLKDSKAAAGYKVVGINTWKAVYRENTNFAIPSSVLKNFIENSSSKKNTREVFDDRLALFNKTVNKKMQPSVI